LVRDWLLITGRSLLAADFNPVSGVPPEADSGVREQKTEDRSADSSSFLSICLLTPDTLNLKPIRVLQIACETQHEII